MQKILIVPELNLDAFAASVLTVWRGWGSENGDDGGVVLQIAHLMVAYVVIVTGCALILGQASRRRRLITANERREEKGADGALRRLRRRIF